MGGGGGYEKKSNKRRGSQIKGQFVKVTLRFKRNRKLELLFFFFFGSYFARVVVTILISFRCCFLFLRVF